MCGIIGIVSQEEFSIKKTLLNNLKKLEYRGYDSVGFVTKEGIVKKSIGKIQPFMNEATDLSTKLGLAHTRWATTGKVTEVNAHPHYNSTKNLFAIHNGIIENFQEIKQELLNKGYNFVSETDTEIIPFFFEDQLKQGLSMQQSLVNFIKKAEGTFAVLLTKKDEDKIYAIKRDSPLVLGICEGKMILSSDVYGFLEETNKVIFFDDNEFAVISPNSYQFFNKNGQEILKPVISLDLEIKTNDKENHPFYMIKEIQEQPFTSSRLINSFENIQRSKIEKIVNLIKENKKIIFVACGTSYHASLVGTILLNKLGYNAHSIIASELESFISFDTNTLAIAVTQSGETMDVVKVLKNAKEQGAKICSIVNVPYSTIQRLSDISIEILAGQEVCVASTKAFTNQIILMLEIAKKLGYKSCLEEISKKIEETIISNENKIKELAKNLYLEKDIFVLGKGLAYPIAREIALKLKEVPYVHAEGMMAGELKHGTIALIEEGTPVISLIPNKDHNMLTAAKEVEARGAKVITIVNEEISEKFYSEIKVPNCCPAEFAIYASIVGHLLSYHIALLKGCEIDFPRNLAKCVTVL